MREACTQLFDLRRELGALLTRASQLQLIEAALVLQLNSQRLHLLHCRVALVGRGNRLHTLKLRLRFRKLSFRQVPRLVDANHLAPVLSLHLSQSIANLFRPSRGTRPPRPPLGHFCSFAHPASFSLGAHASPSPAAMPRTYMYIAGEKRARPGAAGLGCAPAPSARGLRPGRGLALAQIFLRDPLFSRQIFSDEGACFRSKFLQNFTDFFCLSAQGGYPSASNGR